jgi:hypothetical protein
MRHEETYKGNTIVAETYSIGKEWSYQIDDDARESGGRPLRNERLSSGRP